MDLLTAYRRSLYGFTQRVAQVRPHQWSAPTPCMDWDVHALVHHCGRTEHVDPADLRRGHAGEVADRFGGDLLGDDPATAATVSAAAARRTPSRCPGR